MSWDDLAAGWERWSQLTAEASAPVDRWFLDALAPAEGQTILDVGAGTGEAAFLIAEHVGPGGRVLVTDGSEAMVDTARLRARRLGLANVETAVMDAERLTLDDASVDAALCRWTLYLLEDPAAALREMARVVRPGGRVAVGVWAQPDENPLVPLVSLDLVRLGLYDPPPASSHSLDLEPALRDAGLTPVRVEEVPFHWRFASARQAWEYVADAGGAVSRVLRGVDDGTREELRAGYAEALAEAGYVAADGSVAVPALAVNGLGVRPAA
jgi:SAM-dependent methyltransferase